MSHDQEVFSKHKPAHYSTFGDRVTESPRNRALAALYRGQWSALSDILMSDEHLSTPYLAWVHNDYERAAIRLVVVGKETNGWAPRTSLTGIDSANAVQMLMDSYREFALGTTYRGKRSFWTPVHELYRRLNPTAPPLGFVALNASKMDLRGSVPGEAVRRAMLATGLLPREIAILQPDVVVFHTGPAYENWLDGWFPGLLRSGDSWLAHLSAPGLPHCSFRTYHPRYLNYRSQRAKIYDRIVALITGDQSNNPQ